MPSLDWIGKASILNHHNEIPYRLVECNEVIGDLNAGNLIVKGDNLHALKALLPYYKGKVKLIYIDPPYNTGNSSWVYNDAMNAPEIKAWLDKTVDSNDLSRSDKWLCMMYPRLKLLQEFLREDGAIFVSIDDAEVGHLRLIMDSVFGEVNFLTNIIWQHSIQPKGYLDKFSVHHNHILCYGKSNKFALNSYERSDEHNKSYSNPDNDPRGLWRSGDVRNALYRRNLIYDIVTPSGKTIKPPPNGWRWSKETLQSKISTGEIFFSKDETRIIRKIYLDTVDGRAPETIWFGKDVGTTRDATTELKDIFGRSPFDTPKPINVIRRILEIATDKDDIIMDSFAGSGTTAHAVLEQNAMDGGNRKFVLVEMEEYAKNITAERVRRVIEGYDYTGKDKKTLFEKKLATAQILSADKMTQIAEEAQNVIEENENKYDKIDKEFKENTLKIIGIKNIAERKEGIGGGFRYCELGEPIKDENGALNLEVSAEALAKHLFFSEYGVPLEIKAALPYIGSFNESGLYLFFETFERRKLAQILKDTNTSRIVYAASCTIDPQKLKDAGITFRQLPFEIKDR